MTTTTVDAAGHDGELRCVCTVGVLSLTPATPRVDTGQFRYTVMRRLRFLLLFPLASGVVGTGCAFQPIPRSQNEKALSALARAEEAATRAEDAARRTEAAVSVEAAAQRSEAAAEKAERTFTKGAEKPGPETGRAWLVRRKREEGGYALYSYVLLGSPPGPGNRDRYLATINAYLKILPELKELAASIQRAELNVTYMPTRVEPRLDPSAEWVLEQYDYVRARELLRSIPGDYHYGPYIVSSFTPLGSSSSTVIYQDLTSTPPQLAAAWMRNFQRRAMRVNDTGRYDAQDILLKMRTWLAVLGQGFESVELALKDSRTIEH